LAKKLITEMERPPFSPDLVSNDFWLFSKIKSASEGQRCPGAEDIKNSQQEFKKCFQQWQHRCANCTAVQGEYFEGDSSQ
jgi:hypothetical protein